MRLLLLSVVGLLWCGMLLPRAAAQEAYYDSVTRLLQRLIGNDSNYDSDVRPANPVTVDLFLMLKSLTAMDIGKQSMTMKLYVGMTWYDRRLIWDPAEFNNETECELDCKKVWTPPLYIDNKVTAEGLVKSDLKVEAFSYGYLSWGADVSAETECQVSTKYYPFDSQTCSIKFGMFATQAKVDVVPSRFGDFQGFFSENGEWDVVSVTKSRMDVVWESLNQVYPALGYTFHLKRRKAYYLTAIIIPVLLLSVLIVLVFWVPVESGEKMGYCLTILLTYTLFLSIVSDDLPPIATDISYLQVYLGISMGMGVLATFLTILVQRLCYRGNERAPDWLKSLVNDFLLPVTCQRGCKRRHHGGDNHGNGKVADVMVAQSNAPPTFVRDEDEEEVTYLDAALAFDRFFLLMYSVLTLVVTVIFAGLMVGSDL